MYITSRNWTVFYDSILTSNLFQILHVEENLCNVLVGSAWGGVNEDRFMAIFKWHYFLRTVFLLLLFNFSFVSVCFVFCWCSRVGCVCSCVCYFKQENRKWKKATRLSLQWTEIQAASYDEHIIWWFFSYVED